MSKLEKAIQIAPTNTFLGAFGSLVDRLSAQDANRLLEAVIATAEEIGKAPANHNSPFRIPGGYDLRYKVEIERGNGFQVKAVRIYLKDITKATG